MSNEVAVCPKCGHSVRSHYTESDIATFQCWHRNSYENNDFCGCQHGQPEQPNFAFYAVADNSNLSVAKWYRTYSSNRNSGWVKDFDDAKIWTKRGPAQGKCTNLGPFTYLVEFLAGDITVVDQRVRIERADAHKRAAELIRQQELKKRELVLAEKALREAQQKVERLKKG